MPLYNNTQARLETLTRPGNIKLKRQVNNVSCVKMKGEKMLKAKEIMQSNLITAKQDAPVLEVINLLAQNEITGLPVVDDDMTLVGLVSEKDVLGIAYRVLADVIGNAMDVKKIGDIMTKDVVSFSPNDNLDDICQCFMNKPFRRVPVLDNGKVVGIISRKDIIAHAFAKLGQE